MSCQHAPVSANDVVRLSDISPFGDILKVTNTTDSTSYSNGALVVSGGIGVTANINCGMGINSVRMSCQQVPVSATDVVRLTDLQSATSQPSITSINGYWGLPTDYHAISNQCGIDFYKSGPLVVISSSGTMDPVTFGWGARMSYQFNNAEYYLPVGFRPPNEVHHSIVGEVTFVNSSAANSFLPFDFIVLPNGSLQLLFMFGPVVQNSVIVLRPFTVTTYIPSN